MPGAGGFPAINKTASNMDGELIAWITLASGTQVRVRLCAFEDPKIPTPHEPTIARHPHLAEWPEIVAAMAAMKFSKIGTDNHERS